MLRAPTRVVLLASLATPCLAQRAYVGVVAVDESPCAMGVPSPPPDADILALNAGAPAIGVLYHLVGSPARSSVSWAPVSGSYQVIDRNFPSSGPQDPQAVVVTFRMPGDDPAEHRGFMTLFAVSAAPQLWQGLRILREVPTPTVTAAANGNDLDWPSVTNDGFFDCPGPASPSLPRLAGYNLYRLDGMPANVSTPVHYLCGPDADCATTSDNGWIALVPDAPGADGLVRYSDSAGRPDSTYVIQPVLAGATAGSADLDGDTSPELIDPQGGSNLGLTAWAGGPARVILTSGDAGRVVTADALMKLFKLGTQSFRVDWTESGSATRRDLYGGDLAALGPPPPAYAHDDQISCVMPAPVAGNGSQVEMDAAAGNRYYLMAVTSASGVNYGSDSRGAPHPPSGNPCP
jgi:hypothetical protein